MPSTTIHFPDEILADIDRVAGRRKLSRNRFVIEACKTALQQDAGDWPEGFFDLRFTEEEMELLREAALEMEEAVLQNRRNRGAPLL